MNEERWVEIAGFDGSYLVSDRGRVKSMWLHRAAGGFIMKAKANTKGYLQVRLQMKPIDRWCLVHRLVAEAFIPNPLNKPQVNHRSMNILDNTHTNLEWMTDEENKEHQKKARRG